MFCYQIKISGLVQGVFFRYSAQQEAGKLGLVGYVKNLADGSVEIVVCGSESEVKKFINWCQQGPDSATVKKIEVKEVPFQKFQGFQTL